MVWENGCWNCGCKNPGHRMECDGCKHRAQDNWFPKPGEEKVLEGCNVRRKCSECKWYEECKTAIELQKLMNR